MNSFTALVQSLRLKLWMDSRCKRRTLTLCSSCKTTSPNNNRSNFI